MKQSTYCSYTKYFSTYCSYTKYFSTYCSYTKYFQHIAATQNIFQHIAATQNIFQHIAATQNRTFEAKYILQLHKTWHLKQSTYCSHTKHDTWSKVHIAATQNMTFGAKYFTYVLYNVLYILQLHKIIFSPADQPYFPNFNPAVEFFLKV